MEMAIRCSDPDILKTINDIYKELTKENPLERYLKGRTQNSMGFHSKQSSTFSKRKLHGYKLGALCCTSHHSGAQL